jgi:hypothetical protein
LKTTGCVGLRPLGPQRLFRALPPRGVCAPIRKDTMTDFLGAARRSVSAVALVIWRGLSETFVEAYAGNSLKAFALFHLRLFMVGGALISLWLVAGAGWRLLNSSAERAGPSFEHYIDAERAPAADASAPAADAMAAPPADAAAAAAPAADAAYVPSIATPRPRPSEVPRGGSAGGAATRDSDAAGMVICEDGTRERLAEGPPYCEEHGGIAGFR